MRRPKDLEATSQLELGAAGVFEGEPFKLVGRRCVQGARGQIWNEWLVESAHDPPFVLSESWGTFTIFRPGSLLPPLDELQVAMNLAPPWLVVERGTATRLAGWGAVDEEEADAAYVDLSSLGPTGRRGSIVGEDTFVGDPVDPRALGLAPRGTIPTLIPAPNVSPPSGLELWLDVGDIGTLEGVEYRVLGIVARSTSPREDEDQEAPVLSQDYLVHNTGVGLRWLSVADGHWSYATPIEVGGVAHERFPRAPMPARARSPADLYVNQSPLVFEATAGVSCTVVWTAGALPWSADIGELTFVSEHDGVALEYTFHDVSAARVRPLAPDDVARAFGKRALPRPK